MSNKIIIFYKTNKDIIGTETYENVEEINLPFIEGYKNIIFKSFRNKNENKWEVIKVSRCGNEFIIKLAPIGSEINNNYLKDSILKGSVLKDKLKKGSFVEIEFGNLQECFNSVNQKKYFNKNNFDIKDRDDLYKRRMGVLIDTKDDYSLVIPITSSMRASEIDNIMIIDRKHAKKIYNMKEEIDSYLLLDKITTVVNSRIMPPVISKIKNGKQMKDRNTSYNNKLDPSEIKKIDFFLLKKLSIDKRLTRNEELEKELKENLLKRADIIKKMLIILKDIGGIPLEKKSDFIDILELLRDDYGDDFFDEDEIYDILKIKR